MSEELEEYIKYKPGDLVKVTFRVSEYWFIVRIESIKTDTKKKEYLVSLYNKSHRCLEVLPRYKLEYLNAYGELITDENCK